MAAAHPRRAPRGGAILDPEAEGISPWHPPVHSRSGAGTCSDTNVLETTYTTATGTARVTDSLNAGTAGRFPWTELARRLEGLEGRVDMRGNSSLVIASAKPAPG